MKYAIELIRLELREEPVQVHLAADFGKCWAVYDCIDRNSDIVKLFYHPNG